MRVEGEVIIDAPIEQVWDFMADLRTMPQHNLSLVDVDGNLPFGLEASPSSPSEREGGSGPENAWSRRWTNIRD